jgi:uncharacterized metal-binding protein YceD (DUF177 family)
MQILNSQFNILKLPLNREMEFSLDNTTTWVKNLYEEIFPPYQGLSPEEKNEFLPPPEIPLSPMSIELSLKKAYEPETYAEFVLAQGSIKIHHTDACIRCLEIFPLYFETEFAACFLNQNFEADPNYQDLTDLFIQNKTWDLYFYEENMVNLADFFREQIILNQESLPLHDESCLGLCSHCGVNLNLTKCSHIQLPSQLLNP